MKGVALMKPLFFWLPYLLLFTFVSLALAACARRADPVYRQPISNELLEADYESESACFI